MAAPDSVGNCAQVPWGRIGAADWWNLEDSNGQQRTTNVEVSDQFTAMCWDGKSLEGAFTRQRPARRVEQEWCREKGRTGCPTISPSWMPPPRRSWSAAVRCDPGSW